MISGPKPPAARRRPTPLAARGEPFVWASGGGLAVAVLMIVALVGLILWNGARTFWPKPLVLATLADGTKVLGEPTRSEEWRPSADELASFPEAARRKVAADGGLARRRLFRTGNFDLAGDDFRWVPDPLVVREERPADAWIVERTEWGPAIGFARGLLVDGQRLEGTDADPFPAFAKRHREIRATAASIRAIERKELGDVSFRTERARLEVRRVALASGEGSPAHRTAAERAEKEQAARDEEYRRLTEKVESLRADERRVRVLVEDTAGRLLPEKPSSPEEAMLLAQVVRAYPANRLGITDRISIYLSRWKEFLVDEPREANTEGGVFPAIFGTFLMTVLMTLVVGPFGVVAALYLREYAKQGLVVSSVRIAVGNLAGVPSIVFGVFGLGFFCYGLGGRIDALFFPERLPNPTFGTGGILWASLTLALLTVPVVIVATEEALAAVPRSLREGSYGCGASKWQTIRRIVLPHAMPGILTGLVLAMARGAGEVAPLMITGVVKLAPELPFDGRFPFFHLERSFMHLGFHIYDVGFQSRNSEAGKPMVFTTTLLLIVLVAVLNVSAIRLRSRLRRRFRSSHF